jgi:hypothetical protein
MFVVDKTGLMRSARSRVVEPRCPGGSKRMGGSTRSFVRLFASRSPKPHPRPYFLTYQCPSSPHTLT